ncbi:MAG: hypothetical protein WCT08_00475 [Patescibacteria group bacterium]
MKFQPSMQSGFDLRAGVDFAGICPACKTAFDPWSIRLIAQQEEKHLLHIVCQKCQIASLALVLVQAGGLKAFELITDLNQEDAQKFGKLPAISMNEVLAFHVELQNY